VVSVTARKCDHPVPSCSRSVPTLEARRRPQSAAVPSVRLSFVRPLCTNRISRYRMIRCCRDRPFSSYWIERLAGSSDNRKSRSCPAAGLGCCNLASVSESAGSPPGDPQGRSRRSAQHSDQRSVPDLFLVAGVSKSKEGRCCASHTPRPASCVCARELCEVC